MILLCLQVLVQVQATCRVVDMQKNHEKNNELLVNIYFIFHVLVVPALCKIARNEYLENDVSTSTLKYVKINELFFQVRTCTCTTDRPVKMAST